MKTVKRFDNHKIGKNVQVTAQGFLIIPAFTARTGIQHYKGDDGKILSELRPADEVFSESSMSSLRTAVVTDGHPPKMVNPDNVDEFMVGHTNGTVSRENIDGEPESFLATHLVITHRDAIEAIQAGKAELSNGYNVDLEFSAGEHKGQKFDAIQRNIVNNHIAIVWHGRAGNKVKLKLDRNDAILVDEKEIIKPIKGETMKVTIHGKEYDVADELGKDLEAERTETKIKNDASVSTEKTRADEAETKVTKVETEKTTLEAKNDSLESDNKKLKDGGTKTPVVNVDEAVKERISVMKVGEKMLDGETVKKLDTMSNDEIKKAVIKVDSPELDEKKFEKAGYMDARFDHIADGLGEAKIQYDELGKRIVAKRKDDKKDEYKSPEQIRKDNMEKTIENSGKQVGRRADK